MQEDRFAEAFQPFENREERRVVERAAVDVGMDLRAAGVEFGNRAVDLLHRFVGVVHRQAQQEAREPVGVGAADRGHAVIRDPGERRGLIGPAQDVDGRLGHRDDLLVVAELVEQTQPRVHVPQRVDGAPPGYRALGHGLRQCLDEHLGKDVIENVELHWLEPLVSRAAGS